MATIPTPTDGRWDISLWNDFGSGWDVIPYQLVNPGTGIKRFNPSTPGAFGRNETQRFDPSTPGHFVREDQ